ncbi:RagB/SusD family nutrient uptake outer membrane protein [Dyadobacter aurulentus]|uniref:RagB/SusD family nutrient uptake outer membrane protein n=1 Tax=Dyadobacter sp. UC 10 TaxID=2605428 RepID=UPI0011F38D1B|nr:RagB/SusD family nutrient uptake outer membrane protein [Dyadobacter sp. UC 10]KAA0993539.1 RagB/SusD family nutrient uptake outer membrane protein [Dyadobacter sp. UC 10]
MKSILTHRAILLILPLLILSGCSEFLERDNPTATTDDLWWRTQNNLVDYLNAVYMNAIPAGALITDGGTFQANSKMQMAGITDEGVFRGNFGSWQQFVTNQLTPADGYIADMYRFNYANIRDCSRILANYERVYVADTVLKKRFAAEARALRAYSHLQLFQYFGEIPIVDRAIEFADPDAKNLPRNTTEEIVNFVARELETAAADLPVSYSEAELFRMSKGVCYALQVQLYLAVKNYDKVIESFGKLRDLKAFELHKGKYEDVFNYTGLTNKERIWIKPRGNKGIMGRMGPASVQGGQATISVTAALVDAYETLDGRTLDEMPEAERLLYVKEPNYQNKRDPRLAQTVLLPGNTLIAGIVYEPFTATTGNTTRVGYNSANVSGYLVKKYMTEQDRTAQYGSGNLNYIVIRYAEMMLSYVEALVESGQWQHADVKTYLNQIRNRAGLPDYNATKYNSQNKLRGLYRRERMVELALEGTRIHDIRRWQIGKEVLDGPVFGAFDPQAKERVRVEDRIFIENRDYLWPIPQNEINNNSGIRQNPGY